ncbi:MAG: CBS domain-containing protein [Gammaproteobacteria bacterium]|nr:CBS domain-containing protein [Gammaproteobacteria bacterium]
MPKPSSISDCMRTNPMTVAPTENLASAVEKIIEHRLTGLTVVDDQGCVIGVISELDCLRGALSAIYNDGDPEHVLVNEVMSTQVNVCSPEDGIVEVAQQMLDTRQRRRPVVKNGKLHGQVSSKNVLWALMQHTRRNSKSA